MNSLTADQLLTRARAAQHQWAALSVSRRCDILSEIHREIARQCESIADTIALETQKPPLDALSGDVLVTLEHMRYCEAHAPHILRPQQIGKPSIFFRGARFEAHYEPHGVVLIFAPSNYPFQLSVVPLMTALVAGNAVVLKCSERTPETAELILKLCTESKLPRDLVQVIHDIPEQASGLIDAKPDFIFFTGSTHHGQQVAQRAAKHLIPTILELGGKDASIVFADCNLDRAVEGITYGAFSNAGRVCVAVKRAYVEASIYDEFLARLKKRISELHIGTGINMDFCIAADVQSDHAAQVEDALARGVTLHWPQDQALISSQPVLLIGVPADAKILTDESFSPALCIAPFYTEAEAVALANATPYALSSSVWARNRARGRRIAMQLSAGSCSVNDVIRIVANPYAPFGGNGLSGHGRYHGPEGLRAFSRVKTIMLANGRRRRERNWFPFSERTMRQLASLIRFRHGSTGLVARLSRIILPMLVIAFCSNIVAAQSPTGTHLSINVQLTPHAHGELAYLIFGSASGFPGDRMKAVRRGYLPISPNAQQLIIETDLPPGTYAVSVYEDLNSNHKLDHNFIGIPLEPVGASNNPHGRLGPPRFNESSFQLGAAAQIITINMVHGL